jgi:hypothetical protein
MQKVLDWFGPWSSGAVALDDEHTRWPIGGNSLPEMFGALAWIPDGVDYVIEGNADFSQFVAERARRMVGAA